MEEDKACGGPAVATAPVGSNEPTHVPSLRHGESSSLSKPSAAPVVVRWYPLHEELEITADPFIFRYSFLHLTGYPYQSGPIPANLAFGLKGQHFRPVVWSTLGPTRGSALETLSELLEKFEMDPLQAGLEASMLLDGSFSFAQKITPFYQPGSLVYRNSSWLAEIIDLLLTLNSQSLEFCERALSEKPFVNLEAKVSSVSLPDC